jgi:hypothetical protein
MARGRGFTIQRVNTGGSRGVVIHRLGRRQRSLSDVGEGRSLLTPGVQRVSNAALPAHRDFEDRVRCAELHGMYYRFTKLTPNMPLLQRCPNNLAAGPYVLH